MSATTGFGLTAANAATTQTFTTAQSPFPADHVGGGGPNQGSIDFNYFDGPSFYRGPYEVRVGRVGRNSFFTFDLRSACVARGVAVQLVRGSALDFGGDTGGADFTIKQVTTSAEIVNVPGGSPYSGYWVENAIRVFSDLQDGPTYGGGSYPLDGSPSDVLSFPLNAAGVAAVNEARGNFFTLGGSGGGRSWIDTNQFLYRDPIFAGVSDPAKLVVTCAPPTNKEACNQGGWRDLGFDSHAHCVNAAEQQARQECIFIRATHGRPAFRAWYGSGVHKRHAMRRCIRDRSAS